MSKKKQPGIDEALNGGEFTIKLAPVEKKLKKKIVRNPKGNPDVPAFKERKWVKGQTGNPKGINAWNKYPAVKAISKAYEIQLGEQIPDKLKKAFGLKPSEDCTWARAIAMGMSEAASQGDTPAAKEMREVTEGRLPENISLIGKIDYNAGQTAKEQLMSKLGEEEKKS